THFCGIRARGMNVGRRLRPDFYARKAVALVASRKREIRTSCGVRRTNCVRDYDQMRGRDGMNDSSSRDQTCTDVDLRRADRVLLNDLAPVKKHHKRLLVSLRPAMNQTDIGNEIRGLGVHSGEIIFPDFVAAVGEGGLDWIAIDAAHVALSG